MKNLLKNNNNNKKEYRSRTDERVTCRVEGSHQGSASASFLTQTSARPVTYRLLDRPAPSPPLPSLPNLAHQGWLWSAKASLAALEGGSWNGSQRRRGGPVGCFCSSQDHPHRFAKKESFKHLTNHHRRPTPTHEKGGKYRSSSATSVGLRLRRGCPARRRHWLRFPAAFLHASC